MVADDDHRFAACMHAVRLQDAFTACRSNCWAPCRIASQFVLPMQREISWGMLEGKYHLGTLEDFKDELGEVSLSELTRLN